jgi:hypothetical protein
MIDQRASACVGSISGKSPASLAGRGSAAVDVPPTMNRGAPREERNAKVIRAAFRGQWVLKHFLSDQIAQTIIPFLYLPPYDTSQGHSPDGPRR